MVRIFYCFLSIFFFFNTQIGIFFYCFFRRIFTNVTEWNWFVTKGRIKTGVSIGMAGIAYYAAPQIFGQNIANSFLYRGGVTVGGFITTQAIIATLGGKTAAFLMGKLTGDVNNVKLKSFVFEYFDINLIVFV